MLKKIIKYLPDEIKTVVNKAICKINSQIIEIRLRVGQPLEIITIDDFYFFNSKGDYLKENDRFKIKSSLLDKTFIILTENSLYAIEKELKEGFITIEGGHRVGFTGEIVLKNNKIDRIKNINSLNFRINHEIIGVAEKVVSWLYNYDYDYFYNTLLISPPLCGKTTLLRDLVRIMSNGNSELNIKKNKVGVVDERSEIGGAYHGVPQNDLGMRTDLLDKCPKDKGILMLIRTMSPEIIAVDELGDKDDIRVVSRALNTGVKILTTVHGDNYRSVYKQPGIGEMLNKRFFDRFVILSRSQGVGTIEKVLDNKGGTLVGRID